LLNTHKKTNHKVGWSADTHRLTSFARRNSKAGFWVYSSGTPTDSNRDSPEIL